MSGELVDELHAQAEQRVGRGVEVARGASQPRATQAVEVPLEEVPLGRATLLASVKGAALTFLTWTCG